MDLKQYEEIIKFAIEKEIGGFQFLYKGKSGGQVFGGKRVVYRFFKGRGKAPEIA